MNVVFADTSYYLALLNPKDQWHPSASAFTSTFDGSMVTTGWIMLELANSLRLRENRLLFVSLVDELRRDHRITIIPASEDNFRLGVERFGQRLDKEWSLTDCISFVVMEQHSLTDALTTDHHFAQAGFKVLL